MRNVLGTLLLAMATLGLHSSTLHTSSEIGPHEFFIHSFPSDRKGLYDGNCDVFANICYVRI